MAVEVIRSNLLKDLPHGFLGRRGGVSKGVCGGLNVGLGSNDDREAVIENRRLAVQAVAPGARLVTIHQVHSPDAIIVESAIPDEARPHADAMVTNVPGLALGVLTADCAPVLFADTDAGVIGAAHAGWKGALGGVIARTVETMEKLDARRERVRAVIGPAIARRSYEVDDSFRRRFTDADQAYERFFGTGKTKGRHMFDLEGFVASRLAAAGVIRVEAMGLDTYHDHRRFFSYRRATHRGEADYGRQVSLIALPGAPPPEREKRAPDHDDFWD